MARLLLVSLPVALLLALPFACSSYKDQLDAGSTNLDGGGPPMMDGFAQPDTLMRADSADGDANTDADANADAPAIGCPLPDLLRNKGSMDSLAPWTAVGGSVKSSSVSISGQAAEFCASNHDVFFSMQPALGVPQPNGRYRTVVWLRMSAGSVSPDSATVEPRLWSSATSYRTLAAPTVTIAADYGCYQVDVDVTGATVSDTLVPGIGVSHTNVTSQCALADDVRVYGVAANQAFPTACGCP
jgi:hypothetical protein